MNVCDNLGDHLVGNVYVKFKREEVIMLELEIIYIHLMLLLLRMLRKQQLILATAGLVADLSMLN